MSTIIPAILVTTRKELEIKLSRLNGLADTVQIDVVDGKFATPSTWPYINNKHELEEMQRHNEMFPYSDQFCLEADLMVSSPEEIATQWVAAGISRVVIHARSVQDLPSVFKKLSEKLGYEKDFIPDMLSFGVALNVGDDVTLLEPVLGQMNYVQFMGIKHIGVQGEPFDTGVLSAIKTFSQRYPHIPIQVDGGVSLKTAPALLDAGVSRLVIGSAIWNSHDVASRIEEFKALTLQY